MVDSPNEPPSTMKENMRMEDKVLSGSILMVRFIIYLTLPSGCNYCMANIRHVINRKK